MNKYKFDTTHLVHFARAIVLVIICILLYKLYTKLENDVNRAVFKEKQEVNMVLNVDGQLIYLDKFGKVVNK